jgi:hypothetical protein
MKKLLVAGTILLSVAAVYATQGSQSKENGGSKSSVVHYVYHNQNDTVPSKDTTTKKDSLNLRF